MKKAKAKAFEFYKKWRSEKTYCPAFGGKVRISLKGWKHITGATGAKKRIFSDVYRRLKLLPYAKEITKKSTTIQNITEKGGRKFYILEAVVNVKENHKTRPRKVRVVYEEDKSENKVFLSVMDKKTRKKNNW